MEKKGKIYFVSDVHLGAPALNNNREREILFANWLDEIKDDVAELYLMGDIFDFWWDYKKVVPRGFTRILGRIANLTDKGIPVYFFPGNHDLWVYGYFEEELGVKVYNEEIVKEIEGKKFFLGHGDGIDVNDKGYLFLKKIFTNKILQWLFARLHPNFALAVAHKWSKSSRLGKINIKDEFDADNEGMVTFARNYLKNDFVHYFVFGHRHHVINTDLGEKSRFVLLGDWIKNFSYGVFDGNSFELKRYKDRAKS